MSVSLRLAKRNGRSSIQHHPFISVGEIFFNSREEFQPGRMKTTQLFEVKCWIMNTFPVFMCPYDNRKKKNEIFQFYPDPV